MGVRLKPDTTYRDSRVPNRKFVAEVPERGARQAIALVLHGIPAGRFPLMELTHCLDSVLGAKYTGAMKASEMARELGRRGGRARARRLSAAERTRIASLGGRARSRSLEAARRILDTLQYAAAADELRGRPVTVRHLRRFAGRLPGIYPDQPGGSAR